MAYYSGTAGSLTALRTALLTHAQADGWTLTGDVLSKAGVYFKIQETAENITCLGCESNAVSNPAPAIVQIGRLYSGSPTWSITYPCNYEVFGFAQELYLVVNYDVDRYQWMAFGKSTTPGLPGQGGWCGASGASAWSSGSIYGAAPVEISIYGSAYQGYTTAALFFGLGGSYWNRSANYWVNHNLDGHGWTGYGSIGNPVPGILPTNTLLARLPSAWNSETVLLPLRCYKERPSYKTSLVAELQNARHARIDNLVPGDVLVIGSDKWKVFPWFIKNSAARDGGIGHTGTFGWAIRYEGP